MSSATWRLYPLDFGEFSAIERSLFVFHKGFGEKIKAPCTGWLLDNSEEKILVDTGAWDPETAKRYHNYDMANTGPSSVKGTLAKHELTPEDITTVLLTHLHWDHVANVDLFSNATFYVQREEAFYALDPLPPHRLTYNVGLDFEPPWQKILHRTELFGGDIEFRPGLTCHLLPGHTPGSQGILVHTSEGKYLIAGDNVDLQENWDGDDQFNHRPGGIFNNLSDYLQSIERMEKLADVVFPAHDYGIFGQNQYP